MPQEPPSVQLGRVALTKQQRRTVEIMLYRMADLIDRLMADGVQYTKIKPEELTQGGQ